MEKQKVKKQKTFTYPVTAEWVEDKAEMNYSTQLYQSGIYIIFNNRPVLQGTMTPQKMVNLHKKLKIKEKEGKITSLCLGREITVSKETGFWEEVPSKEEISIQKKVEALLKTGNTVNITDKGRKIQYKWTVTAIDKENDSITFTSLPTLIGLEEQVKREGENNTCLLSAFRATVQNQLYG